MEIVVFNLGCKVNQYECDAITQALRERGHNVCNDLQKADCYIINTCAVTNEAERKSRQSIARCIKFNSNAKILVCGCASQKSPKDFEKDNVVYISGVAKKQQIIDHIEENICKVDIFNLPLLFEKENLTAPPRTRAYVKIQDGCNNFCSYCIIPYLRGRSRSRNIDDIVSEVMLLSQKTKEIVITGINLQQYGEDINTNLTNLIDNLQNIDVRIRLGSFYVEAVNVALLESLQKLKNFCPHFHLSLQSGCDEVLKAMNRHYTTEQYLEKLALIKKYFPSSSITTDIIVGFPTETEQNFETTIKFVQKVEFADIHIFPFSAREGTKASALPQVDKQIINERKQRLNVIKQELINNFEQKNIGVLQEVLFEEKYGDYSVGYSKNYLRIYAKCENEIGNVLPIEKYKDGLKGEIYGK